MVKEILTSAGFVEDETFTESSFIQPPEDTSYAVYLDDIDRRGADNLNLITDHSVTIELYEYYKDPETEAKIEAEFDKRGIAYHKEPRYWLEDEQLWQVLYTFNHTNKGV